MYIEASRSLRTLYCLAVLSAIFPFSMSGWVAATLGAFQGGGVFVVFPIAFLGIGLWRIYVVARRRETLDSYVPDGALKIMRVVGIIGMVVAVIYLVLRLGSGPFLRSLSHTGDVSTRGILSYVAGVYFALFSGVASLGLMIFEFSRLLGFERQQADVATENS
jgi:hypothetical protein